MAGANWGAKSNTCLAALPGTGGIADMSELNGTQTLGTAIAIPANDTLYCGSGTNLTETAAITMPNAKAALIGPNDQSCVITKGANLDQVTVSAANDAVRYLNLVGASGSFTGNGIVLTGGGDGEFAEYNQVSGEASAGIALTTGKNYV